MLGLGSRRSVIRETFEFGKKRAAEIGAENVYDFSLGNPSVEPPQIVTDTLQQLLRDEEPTALHGYTSAQGDAAVREAIAGYIRKTHGVEADANYIYMTCGAAASLTISLSAICVPGDEVITFAPYFTEYKVFSGTAGAKLIALDSDPDTFQIDLYKLEEAINERTAAVLINSPNNPSGVVYREETIIRLAQILRNKSAQFGKTIYLITDEPIANLFTAASRCRISPSIIRIQSSVILIQNRFRFPASASVMFLSIRRRIMLKSCIWLFAVPVVLSAMYARRLCSRK